MIIRQLSPEFESDRLSNFDASFSTERIYQVFINEMSVEIKEVELARPIYKTYPFDLIKQDLAEADFAVLAENGDKIGGLAMVKYEEWNNRANLTGIYVSPDQQGRGLGRALLEAVIIDAQSRSARCLFVETQNVNYPAISFYRKMNFEFCGFDRALYNPAQVLSDEIAFYFCQNLLNENT